MSTYYVDGAVGNDVNDGLDEGAGSAWATIDKAMNTATAGDKVYVKASATYNENPAIDVARVGTLASPVVYEGYTSSPGDGGQAAITGEIQDVAAGRLYYVFKNFDISNIGGAGSGQCVDLDGSNTTWKNCKFHNNNVVALVTVTTSNFFEACEFNDGTGDGCICVTAAFVGCKFYRNSLGGIDGSGAVFCFFCEFFSNGSSAIDGGATNDTFLIAINNTVDGDSKDTTYGIIKNPVIHGAVVAVNNILYDCITGMRWGAGGTDNAEFGISINNLLDANTDDYAGGAYTSSGEVTSAPEFTDEENNDYSLGSGSPAQAAGFDLQGNMDIGAHQAEAAGEVPPLYPWHVGGA